MAINYYLLNTFSNEKSKGNPALVCLPEAYLSIVTLLFLTRKFNITISHVKIKSSESIKNFNVKRNYAF